MKRCKICRNKFEPRYSTLQPTCNEPTCMAEWGRRNHDKFVKSEIKALAEKHKDRKYYLKLTQTVFNTFIRIRDKNKPCISCGNSNTKTKMNAGHFWNVQQNPAVRFDEMNVYLQCEQCNSHLSGNLLAYRERLIEKIGSDEFDALNLRRNEVRKWTIEELKELIRKYRNKIKLLR